jgi:MFS family permease
MTKSPLLPIFLTVFVDVLGLTLMLPLLPFYAKEFVASPVVITSLAASYAACQLVAGPILGSLSDRVGRKPVLMVSQAGTLVGLLLIAAAGLVARRFGTGAGLATLFAGRIIDGLTAGNLSIAQAYIADVTRPENRTRSFALIGIAFGMGFLVGPGISGELDHFFGHSGPPLAAALLSLTSIVFSGLFVPNQAELEKLKVIHGGAAEGQGPPVAKRGLAFARFFTQPAPRHRLLQFFCYTTSFAVLTGGLALFLGERFQFDVRATGRVFMISGLMGALLQGAMGRMVRRFGEVRLAFLGFLSMALGYPLVGLVGSKSLFYLIVIFTSFGVTVVRPSVTTLITRSVGRHEQGAALGASQSMASISQIVGPLLAGVCIERHLLWAYGFAAAFFAVLGLILSAQRDPTADPVGST